MEMTRGRNRPPTDSANMPGVTWRRSSLVFFAAVIAVTISPAWSAEQKSSEPGKAEVIKDAAGGRSEEAADPSRTISGAAARAECIWLGERAVGLMWRDDLDTAFRHLDLYDRFGCPGEHVQVSFRCVVRQGSIDPKATETFNARVHSCWLNPATPPPPPSTAAVEKPGTK
jgi:hypothetical protein